jgi:hypothetical protein
MRAVNFALRYLYRIVSRWKSSVELQTRSWGKYYFPFLGHELHPLTLQSVGSQNALPLLCVSAAGSRPLPWNTIHEDDLYFIFSKIHTLYAMRAHMGVKVSRHGFAYNLGLREWWCSTSRSDLFIHWTGCWVGLRAGLEGYRKFRFYWFSNPEPSSP